LNITKTTSSSDLKASHEVIASASRPPKLFMAAGFIQGANRATRKGYTMLNEVHIIGRLGQDPDAFDTKNGRGARLSVATSSYVGGEEKTEWHRVVVFGKAADFTIDYLSKGRLVFIEGRLETSSYEKNGVKMYSTQIVAYRVLALDKGEKPAASTNGAATNSFTEDAEDVPF
jgi:single-strand DNA-binding protein